MVSRVYTPLVTPYSRSSNFNGNRGPVSSATEEPKQHAFPAPQQAATPEAPTGPGVPRSSADLKSVQYDHLQKIPLHAVIHDFKSTMTALGADENTRAEVAAYLNVVRLQAAKSQPEVPFIKHTLRTAANSLDQFIGNALGQPSKVVKEWVDALLLQDIEYHAEFTPDEVLDTPGLPDEKAANSQEAPSSPAMETNRKAQIKSLIESAKTTYQNGHTSEAHQPLEQALALLEDQDKPDWEGKIWHLRGRFYDDAGQWEAAINAFERASQKFEAASLPQKQANSLHAMASILEERGQMERAASYYQQVVALDRQHGNAKSQLRSLNDLGSIYLRQGSHSQAIESLQQAAALCQTHNAPAAVQSDIFSNLAAAFRQGKAYDNAIQTYQQSLQLAKAAKDKSRYAATLQQLASVFVEANQPEQAMKALQKLKTLG